MIKETGIFCGELSRNVGMFNTDCSNGFLRKAAPCMFYSEQMLYKDQKILKLFISYMNNNQHDALFIFGVWSYHTSTCQLTVSRPGQAR
jgi:hypothetical protein